MTNNLHTSTDIESPSIVGTIGARETLPVLHLINGEYYAGAERVQDLLAGRLPEFGFSVGFVCLKPDVFPALRESRSAPLYELPMWTKFDLHKAWRVSDIVRAENYRLLHAHTVRGLLVGAVASRLTGVPLIYHFHSPTRKNTGRGGRDRWNAFVERLGLQYVSRVIAVSRAMADEAVRQGFDPQRIAIVYNGVKGPQQLPPRPKPEKSWIIGTAALFRPRKGVEVLLEALALLRNEGREVHLRAVGTFESSNYERQIAALIRELFLREHVSWVGFQRDIAAELQRLDLFVLPSLYGEGLPMVVLEAMAWGAPVIATDIPGIEEVIRHGETGLLVPPGNPRELAAAIAAVMDGGYDWSKIRTAAFQRQVSCFSDYVMAADVAAVYRDLLENG